MNELSEDKRRALAKVSRAQGVRLEEMSKVAFAQADALDPRTSDEEGSMLDMISNVMDKIEDTPLGMIPQVKVAGKAVDAVGDLANALKGWF